MKYHLRDISQVLSKIFPIGINGVPLTVLKILHK
jgi:hypothetical protein